MTDFNPVFQPISDRTAICRFDMPGRTTQTTSIVVHYAPASSHPARTRAAALEELEDAAASCPASDIRIVAGDFNAPIGNRRTAQGGVCGPHGNPRLSTTGLQLRQTIASLGMFAAATFHRNAIPGTWFHPASHSAHTIDNFFLDSDDKNRVRKCVTAPPLLHSGHMSVRLHLTTSPPSQKKEPFVHGEHDWISTRLFAADGTRQRH
jgi:endonuclease/exonuclease/phosphatase family metal-dependent hydrolase